MSAIHDLLAQIQDEALRDRIAKEVDRITKTKKFGLVFEQHLPECTPLFDMPIKVGTNVMLRNSKNDKATYSVLKIDGENVVCGKKDNLKETTVFAQDELVRIAEFGESIYPYLKPIDSICNDPESPLWHTLIEADNYHALQLLEYLYPGKVDCIYIDPPYNTGARDWKYNNDYVDSSDAYRHSKWLSMMEKRLKLAKKLLNPKESVLIVTIDEKEYLHLGCLLEELFPDSKIQMISSVINSGGAAREQQFFRTDEYIFICEIGSAYPQPLPLGDEWAVKADKRTNGVSWRMSLVRGGSNASRDHSPGCFYPIFVASDGSHIVDIGEPLEKGKKRDSVIAPEGTVAIWPMRTDGSEGVWQMSPKNLREAVANGYVRLGRFTETGMAISYLNRKEIEKVHSEGVLITGRRADGSIITDDSNFVREYVPGTQWRIASHNARVGGTNLIKQILGDNVFSYPKSLYAVKDVLRFFVNNKKDALILDFFAGSGTTLHAVNLLNAEDNGRRRCIIVTNNEVSGDEATEMTKKGLVPGDEMWEREGIARKVTWPRTVCSIMGKDVFGNDLKGDYIGSGIPMSNGFKTNVSFFKLSFLDKTLVALGCQFNELLPILWMKTGAHGKCPEIKVDSELDMLILPENGFAVLLDDCSFSSFEENVNRTPEIKYVFIVSDYDANYRSMAKALNSVVSFQLYRDYLDNFRISSGRN